MNRREILKCSLGLPFVFLPKIKVPAPKRIYRVGESKFKVSVKPIN